jgi:hypothetical protein
MRKKAGIWLVLLILALFSPPLSAECYKCESAGMVCNGSGWCEWIFLCRTYSDYCSSCWLSCREEYDGCYVSGVCYWVGLVEGDLPFPDATQVPIQS